MSLLGTLVLAAVLPLPQGPPVVPQLGLLRGSPPSVFDAGLGSGGLGVVEAAAGDRPAGKGRATSPGGVVVECREQGVKLTFPSGREVLVAPDGHLHLRDGAVSHQFGGGVALMLADGAEVRVLLNGSRRMPLQEVQLCAAGAAHRLWRRRDADDAEVRLAPWHGDRLWCLGDGGALYRAVALGPLVTMRCELRPKDANDARLPENGLLLATGPVLASLQQLHGELSRAERERFREVSALCAAPEALFGGKGVPRRIDGRALRYVLPSGYVLQIDLEGPAAVLRLSREAGSDAFAEWRLAYGADLRAIAVEANRQVSPLVRLAPLQPELAARLQRNESFLAFAVLRALAR